MNVFGIFYFKLLSLFLFVERNCDIKNSLETNLKCLFCKEKFIKAKDSTVEKMIKSFLFMMSYFKEWKCVQFIEVSNFCFDFSLSMLKSEEQPLTNFSYFYLSAFFFA